MENNEKNKKIEIISSIVCVIVIIVACIVFWRMFIYEANEPVTNTEVTEENPLDISVGDDEAPVPVWKELTAEIHTAVMGIDVSEFQGLIEWDVVNETNAEFAMIRVGNRNSLLGDIEEDIFARYNLQEATANGIMVGAYFVSTAITKEEVLEEVTFLCDILDGYSITYPVVYDCEGFQEEDHRQYDLSAEERTELAMYFLEEVEKRGYVGMFYSSSYDAEYDENWITSEIELKYRVWVAQYLSEDALDTEKKPIYEHEYSMWQYSQSGTIEGITGLVDLNTSYFSCSEVVEPIAPGTAEVIESGVEIGVEFDEVNEEVTPKEEVNVRSTMDQNSDSNIIGTIANGTVVTRTGIGDNEWSRIIYNGEIGYVISNYVTTDLSYSLSGDESQFNTVFTTVNEKVTAKEITNLRDIPSVEDPSQVIYQLKNGETAIRTGTSNEGWSRVEYNGQVLYCISSYLELAE